MRLNVRPETRTPLLCIFVHASAVPFEQRPVDNRSRRSQCRDVLPLEFIEQGLLFWPTRQFVGSFGLI